MNIETVIRTAYAKIAARTDNPYVGLAALRTRLDPSIAREDVDQALDQMIERPDVHLTAELNQRLLTDADHAAAVDIADEPRHVLYIEPTAPVETEQTLRDNEQLVPVLTWGRRPAPLIFEGLAMDENRFEQALREIERWERDRVAAEREMIEAMALRDSVISGLMAERLPAADRDRIAAAAGIKMARLYQISAGSRRVPTSTF
jgi:hypothetical protein